MQEKKLTVFTNGNAGNSDGIKALMSLFNDMKDHWGWLIFSYCLCLSIALVYLRYITPRFLVTASILVRDDSKGAEFGDTAFLESMGLTSVKSSVDNEVEILKSRTLMESVVEDLQLNVRYFSSGHVKTTELYDKSPVKLKLLDRKNLRQRQSITYNLTIGEKNRYQIRHGSQFFNGSFGDTIMLPIGPIVLERTSNLFSVEDQYSVTIQDPEQLVDQYRKALTVAATNKLVSTVNLSLDEVLPKKGEAILEQLLINYFKANVDDKNRIADSTIAFIDKNLDQVSTELVNNEKTIEQFRTSHHITDLGEDIRQLTTRSSEYERELNKYNVQSKTVIALLQFLHTNPQHLVPAQLFIQDPGFLTLIEKYNSTQLALVKDQTTLSKSHPSLNALHAQLQSLRDDLMANVSNQQKDLQIGIRAMADYQAEVQEKLKRIPSTERQFLEAKRQQQIKQELYILLLKKRVETSISKSATLANAWIIDKPKSQPDPVKPNKQLVILVSGFIGIGFPLTVLHLKQILNTRIINKSDITAHLNVNVMAEISHQSSSEKGIYKDSQGQIAEQFRVLRTNVQCLPTSKKHQVILLTSSMGSEGKSFVAVNLCSSLALTGKKVMLLELDLRKPQMAKTLRLKPEGFTNYISSGSDLSVFIQTTHSKNAFSIITAGTIPPNPAELLALPQVDEVIQLLKSQYDYIILDTPPIGLVTDARLLTHLADISLYIVRQHFTYKSQLELIKDIQEGSQLPNLHLVLNDIKESPGYSNAYGYYKPEKQHFLKTLKQNFF